MTNISRRSLAKGTAWSIPAIATAAAAPALAASSTTSAPGDCKDNIPASGGPFWPSNGSHSVSSTGGGANTNITQTVNFGINDNANTGSVSVLFNDGAGQSYVPRAYVTLNDGQTLCGNSTLGGTASFVAPTGVSTSTAIMWDGSAGLTNDTLWNGVTAHIPFYYYWTDPKSGFVYSAQYEMLVTYPSTNAISAGIQAATIQYVLAPSGCATRSACDAGAPTISNVTPNYPKAGSTVTITGTNFTPSSEAYYYGNKLTTTYVSPTQIQATMPATWPAGTVWGTVYDFAVCNPGACSDGYGIARGV